MSWTAAGGGVRAMSESSLNSENRDDVLHVPNLFEYFCQRTSEDFRNRVSGDDPPTVSFASLVLSFLAGMAFFIFGKPHLAKATFVVFGLLVLWTVWGVVVRSNSRSGQKADDIRNGSFPPEAAPFVLARLKWWNSLVSPARWAKHSRIYDRRIKLERKIAELQKQIEEAIAKTPSLQNGYQPPSDEEVAELAGTMQNFLARKNEEAQIAEIADPFARLRAELVLHLALMFKIEEMAEKLDRIEKLTVVFQNFSPSELSSVVSEALQVLEERRILVLQVDKIEPENFIDLVTVRIEL